MDIVLEGFDRFLFDYPYAKLLPTPTAYGSPDAGFDATSSLKEVPAAFPVNNGWTYQPASDLIQFGASKWAYESEWTRDNIYRQAVSLYIITWIFGLVVYFFCAGLSYLFVFDKATFNHPKYLKNQIRLEIRQTMISLPIMAIFTVPFFLIEIRGFSRLYDTTAEGPGMWYNIAQFPIFICFTDFFIYWIHRYLHHPLIYKKLHKPHHKWIMPTPFASHAFHPLDGWAQSVPYHVFPLILPLQKWAYVLLFIFINVWTVLIHDGEYVAESPIINGAACHTMHHLYFNFNYGQFTTLWDRLGGSYRKPNDELFRKELKMSGFVWAKQSKEMEEIVKAVEGEDDRTYLPDTKKTK